MTVSEHSQAIRARISGFWRLVDVVAFAIPSGTPIDPGGSPAGYIYYDPSGFMLVFMTRGVRPLPAAEVLSKDECERLMKTMTSYCGRWRVEPDASQDTGLLFHDIEVSWNEIWNGSSQRREFKLESNRLSLSTSQPPKRVGPCERCRQPAWE